MGVNSRRLFLHGGLSLVVLAAIGRPVLAQTQVSGSALRMAVHPYAGALSLANTFRPLQLHLEKSLQRPVEFYTAASFDAYVASLMGGEYDIAIAPPHFAVLAIEKGYTPLVHFQARLEPVLAMRADSGLRTVNDLRGKRIAMADKSAFIRIVIVRWLAENGLIAGKDYQIVERLTHAASTMAVVVGEADAALATTTSLKQMAADVQPQLFALSPGLRFPHLFTLGHQRMGADGIERLRQALKKFGPATPQGREFFEKSAYGGYEEVTEKEIRQIRPYAEAFRQMAADR